MDKRCNKCGEVKPLTEYYLHSRTKKPNAECKKCHYYRTLDWRRANKEKCRQYAKKRSEKKKVSMSHKEHLLYKKNHFLKQRFDMSLDDYNAILLQQRGVCAICGQPETATRLGITKMLGVDHDHATGEIRGLLCVDCNQGIGRFKDNSLYLESAIKYLEG